jgi:hypothetical protein
MQISLAYQVMLQSQMSPDLIRAGSDLVTAHASRTHWARVWWSDGAAADRTGQLPCSDPRTAKTRPREGTGWVVGG